MTKPTIAAVSSSAYLDTGVSYSTVSAPAVSTTYSFTHWTNSSEPTTSYRDVWGRSQNPISLVLLEVTTATAHYLPAARDTDLLLAQCDTRHVRVAGSGKIERKAAPARADVEQALARR